MVLLTKMLDDQIMVGIRSHHQYEEVIITDDKNNCITLSIGQAKDLKDVLEEWVGKL